MSILPAYNQDKVFAFLATLLRAAGDALSTARSRDLRVRRKKDDSLVSEADLASNAVIQKLLQTHYPDAAIISEEQEYTPELLPNTFVWVIDPLDGTSNFINAYPFFCVSIALMEVQDNGKLVSRAGGIFDPNADKMYLAYRGCGAFCNGKPIKVADERAFTDCFLVTSLCTGGDTDDAKACSEIVSSVSSVRADGSSALDLALVAEGVYDGLWQTGLKLWDIAAGYLLVSEAGGNVCHTYVADAFDPMQGNIVAGNRATAAHLVAILNRSR